MQVSAKKTATLNLLNNKEVKHLLYDRGSKVLCERLFQDMKIFGDVPYLVKIDLGVKNK